MPGSEWRDDEKIIPNNNIIIIINISSIIDNIIIINNINVVIIIVPQSPSLVSMLHVTFVSPRWLSVSGSIATPLNPGLK